MKLAYDFSKSLLLINTNLTKEIFILKTGAQDGYALNMFSRMYDSITSELIDVDKEYMKYYSFEYDSLERFLYRKYNLKKEDIAELIEERNSNPDCILYRKDDNSYGDYGITQLAFSESVYDRVIGILMLKNQTDEN
jgi:hypothetical protein